MFFVISIRVGLLERMPILEKTSGNSVLSNGDSRVAPEEDEIMSSAVNSRHNVVPARQPNEVNEWCFNH